MSVFNDFNGNIPANTVTMAVKREPVSIPERRPESVPVQNIQSSTPVENADTFVASENTTAQSENEAKSKRKGGNFTDILSSKVVNKKDIEDSVTMPRAIFKGYLCFTAGTAAAAIANELKGTKPGKLLNIAGAALSVLGTYNFVKPFIYKEKSESSEQK